MQRSVYDGERSNVCGLPLSRGPKYLRRPTQFVSAVDGEEIRSRGFFAEAILVMFYFMNLDSFTYALYVTRFRSKVY